MGLTAHYSLCLTKGWWLSNQPPRNSWIACLIGWSSQSSMQVRKRLSRYAPGQNKFIWRLHCLTRGGFFQIDEGSLLGGVGSRQCKWVHGMVLVCAFMMQVYVDLFHAITLIQWCVTKWTQCQLHISSKTPALHVSFAVTSYIDKLAISS